MLHQVREIIFGYIKTVEVDESEIITINKTHYNY